MKKEIQNKVEFKIKVTMKSMILLLNAFILLSGSIHAAQIHTDTLYAREWNQKKMKWHDYQRTILIYSGETKISEVIQVACKNRWENYYFRNFSYNQSGTLAEIIEKSWNSKDENWVNTYREIHSYDEHGRRASVLYQKGYKGNFVDETRENIVYLPDGRISEKIVMEYFNDWQNLMRYTFLFDAGGRVSFENIQYWNDGNWDVPVYIIEYLYDGSGRLECRVKNRNRDGETITSSKEVYMCNESGHLCQQINYTWNDFLQIWEKQEKIEFVNDNNENQIAIVNQIWDEDGWMNNHLSETLQLPGAEEVASNPDDLSFYVIPGVFRNSITLEFVNPMNQPFFLKIMSKEGDVIRNEEISDNRITIPGKELARGDYFVEVKGDSWFTGVFSW